MARDIPIVGKIKSTINIILSAFLGFNLIKYLYNLMLATLGIDNPYLYERDKDKITETHNINTGETTYSYRDKRGKTTTWRTGGKKW